MIILQIKTVLETILIVKKCKRFWKVFKKLPSFFYTLNKNCSDYLKFYLYRLTLLEREQENWANASRDEILRPIPKSKMFQVWYVLFEIY